MKKLVLILCCAGFFFQAPLSAQRTEDIVKVIVAPDHTDWIYKKGENVKFSVYIFKNGNLVKNAGIRYEIGPEKMEPFKKDTLTLSDGKTIIDGGTLKAAGFLRCTINATVDGKVYQRLATAGFDPLTIAPTVDYPKDFISFWDNAKNELSKVPIDARMTLLPERCTEKVNVYHLNLQNFSKGSRVYGILCVPKKEGKYPALLRVPGAGVRAYSGDIAMAEKGVITLEIGIHGIPVNLDPSVYTSLGVGALSGYPTFNIDNKDDYYYKRVYLGCVRANDFLVSLPQFDGERLGVWGGSQGGALSIVTAALDKRVKFLAALYPALSDVTGFLNGRAGGWPQLFREKNPVASIKEKVATISYYDVVNFARQLTVPGIYSWGFNDETCPPTSMYASYNVIKAPKTLTLYLETGHWQYGDQSEMVVNWLTDKLKN